MTRICSFVTVFYKRKTGSKFTKNCFLFPHLYNVKKGLVPAKAVSFCTIADYLGMVLTGRNRPLIHISQAAGMGLYDPAANDFRRDVAADAGMDLSMLPAVTAEITQLGVFRGIPVSASLGDNQASFIGSVTDGGNTVLANIGTGAQISVLSNQCYEWYGAGVIRIVCQYPEWDRDLKKQADCFRKWCPQEWGASEYLEGALRYAAGG